METQKIAGAIIATALVVSGAGMVGTTNASEVVKIDATRAQSIGEVIIEKTTVAPATTVERFTVNDVISEIEMLTQQRNFIDARIATLTAKLESVQPEAQAKFQAEETKWLNTEKEQAESALDKE